MQEKLLKRKGIRRVLSLMLALVMCVSLLPVSGMKVQAAEYTLTPLPSVISNKIIKPVSGLTAEQAKEICKDSSYDVVIYKVEDNLAYYIVKLDSGWAEGRPENFGYLSTITLYNWAVIGTVETHEHDWAYGITKSKYTVETEDTFIGYCNSSECPTYSMDYPIKLRLRVPDIVLAGTDAPAYFNDSEAIDWKNETGKSKPVIKYYADASLSTPIEDITAKKGGTYYAAAKIEGTEVVAKTKFTIAYVVDNLVTGEPAIGEKLSTPNINEWSGYETPDAFWKNAFITNANSDLSAKCHWIYIPYGESSGKNIDDVTFNNYGKSELTIDESWNGGSIYVEMDFGNGIVLCSKPMNIKTQPFKFSWKEDSFVGQWNTYPGATNYWVVLYKNDSAITNGYGSTRPGSVGNVKEYDFKSMIEAQGTGKYKFSVSPYVSDKYINTGMKSSEIIYCSSHTYGEYMADDEGKHYQKCTFCNRESEHEAHYGGTANCKNKAVCEVCSKEYGEVDLTKHDYSESVPNGDGTFKIVCKICGKDYEPVITVDGLLVGTGFIGNTLTTNINDDIVDEYYDDKLKPNDSSADPLQYGKFYYIPKDSDEEVLIDSSKIISDSDGVSYKLVIKEEWADGQIYVQYENIYGKKYVSKRIPIYKVRGQISVDNLEYTIDVMDDTFFATLTGPSDLSGDIVIPEKITSNGIDIPVTAIADNLFTNNQNITSVTMSDTVKSIGTSAFLMCKNLKSLVLSNNIDASKFYADPGGIGMIKYCEKLESINIPATVEIIPYDFFWGIPDIKEITLPSSIKSIAENTFNTFDSLETVRFLGTEEEWNTLINENCGEGNEALKSANVTCHIHSGGTATCTKKAVCEDCGEEYGELENHDFSKYVSNGDGIHKVLCKDCDAVQEGHDKDACSGGTATCTAKAKCSKCGEEYGTLAAHKGGTATCKAKAKCIVCGKAYGELAAHKYDTKWSTDATNHWHACTVCEAKKDSAAHADSNKDGKCDMCSYNMHSHSGTKVAQVDATCSSYGVKAYYKCSCGKYFTDSACTKEITDLAAWKSGDGRIEKKEHTLKTTTTKATFSANGKKETKCTVCGKVTKTETIYAAKTIKLSASKYTYDGKVKKPSVTIKDSKGNAIASTNYTVTYPSGRKNVGKYTVKVTFKGNYSGSKSISFTINPPKTSISKLTAGKKAFTVKWAKKTSQVTGYEIQYSTSSSFKSGNKTVKVTSAKTVSKAISKLTGGKKYYVRIRTYKTVNKANYYSDWSAKKSVTTKK